MKRQRLARIVGAVVAMATCPWAFAQGRPPASDAAQQRIRMLDHVPADAVAFVMVGNLKEMCSKVDAFVAEFFPPRAAKEFSFLKTLTAGRKLGEGFNASGPLALVLLDPVVYARDLAGRKMPASRPAEEPRREGEDIPEGTRKDLPVLWILSGTDVAKMFPELKVEREGRLLKITASEDPNDRDRELLEDREPSWALEKDGLVFISDHKKIIQEMPPKVPVLVRITGGGERLALESDVMGWINRPKVDELKETAFGKIFWRDVHIPVISDLVDEDRSNPASAAVWWFIVTRDEIFRQGGHLMGGLTWTQQGPRVEFRICCKPGGAMAKALAAAQTAQGPLTTALPDKRFIFAYGIRKDLFASPPEVKKAQLAALVKSSAWGEMPKEKVQAIADLIAAVHPEVTGVEHWAGQISDDGPLAVASVVHCRDAEGLKKIVRRHLPAIETLVNIATMQHGDDENERFKLTYQEADEPAEGQVKADVILASHAAMEKMLEDEDTGARMKSVLLKVFPGETRFRVRLATIDKKTLVVTVGGGRKFLAEAVAAARANSSKLELSEDAREALALLPPNRFAVAMVDISSVVCFYGKAMISMFGEMMGGPGMGIGGAAMSMKPAPPIVVALSADKNDLVVTAHVPTKLLKRVVGGFTGMDEAPAEEEDDFPGARRPTTQPASMPAALPPRRVGVNRAIVNGVEREK